MKIAIIGVGHMGTWLMKQLAGDNEIVLFDKKEVVLELPDSVRWLGAVSELQDFAPELFINTVTLGSTLDAYEESLEYLAKDCILSDMTTVKDHLVDFYLNCGHPFVSVHPMFGPSLTEDESLKEESVVIVEESDAKGSEIFSKLFSKHGVKVYNFAFREHDKKMAYSLTTPFVASLVFAGCIEKTNVPGTTFSKHKELAEVLLAEDDHLLSEVLFNPRSLSQIENITARLEFLKHVIRDNDCDEAKKYFAKLKAKFSE